MEVFALGSLAEALSARLALSGTEKIEVSSLVVSGKEAAQGSLFVAVPGVKLDGHTFLHQAFSNGAKAAVVTNQDALCGRPGIVVKDSREALGKLAALFCGNPSKDLKVIGITGTNGKTTTNWLVYHALNALGLPSIRIGTLGVMTEKGYSNPDTLTTPGPIEVQRSLKTARELGIKSCVMEVSSHSLDQKRVDDVQFDVAVFTNLTRDHLDYHKEMGAYFQAKKRLFELLSKNLEKTRGAVLNLDTEEGRTLRSELKSLALKDFSFGRREGSPFQIKEFTQSTMGSCLQVWWQGRSYKIKSAFIGEHNAENLTAAFASLVALGLAPEKCASALESVPQVPGRLENVGNSKLAVYVDYAHTPDALLRAAACLRPVTAGKLWILFGCGGDRDKGKRPQMAEIAAKFGDRIVVTSDNPRTENADAIIEDILNCPAGGEIRRSGIVEPDRRKAIELTVERAEEGDVILLAGKGHEDYQIIGTVKHHFSDQEEVGRALRNRGLI